MSEQHEQMIEVGLRMISGQLDFFGIDEVNHCLRNGMAVVKIEKGRALMKKSRATGDNVKLRFEGFSVVIVVRTSPQ